MSQSEVCGQLALIISVVQNMSQGTRRVITLRHVYQFTQPQIADYLKMTPENVHRHLVAGAQRIADAVDVRVPQADLSRSPASCSQKAEIALAAPP